MRLVIAVAISLLLAPLGFSATADSDPKAVAIMTQSLTAAGPGRPLSAVSDFTATGTITYFWAGDRV